MEKSKQMMRVIMMITKEKNHSLITFRTYNLLILHEFVTYNLLILHDLFQDKDFYKT